MNKLKTLIAAFVFSILASSLTHAGEIQPYHANTLSDAKKTGQAVLIDFYADWCPICRAQEPTIVEMSKSKEFEKLVIFRVDYDIEKELRKEMKVPRQATLVLLKGKKEVARIQGETDALKIQTTIRTALK